MYFGLQKLTLLDFPGRVACTVFTKGCDLRCPFCHNASLVVSPDPDGFSEDELLKFLESRKGVLDGVCITGGEPTIYPLLPDMIADMHRLGYAVKLDTNGTRPDVLAGLMESKSVDYVAMDIKNSPDGYAETVGIRNFDLTPIRESVELLRGGDVKFEFRTTVVKEFHNAERMEAIADWLAGEEAYFLQQFVDSGDLIQSGLNGCSKEEMEQFRRLMAPKLPNIQLRGV